MKFQRSSDSEIPHNRGDRLLESHMARSSFMNVDIVKHQYDRPMTWELIVYDIAITFQSFVEELAAD